MARFNVAKSVPNLGPSDCASGFSSHRPSARRQSRDSTREVSDVMTRIDHVSATTDEPTVSGAGSLPEPRPRPGRHTRPAPRRICAKRNSRRQSKMCPFPATRPTDRPLRSLPFPPSGGHPQLRGDGTRGRGECPSPARPTFPPTAARNPTPILISSRLFFNTLFLPAPLELVLILFIYAKGKLTTRMA